MSQVGPTFFSSSGDHPVGDGLTRMQTTFAGASSADVSQYSIGSGVNTLGTLHDGYYQVTLASGATKRLVWTDSGLAKLQNEPYTFEVFLEADDPYWDPVGVSQIMSVVMFLSAGFGLAINGFGGAVPSANELSYEDTINGAHTYTASVDFFASLPVIHHFAFSVASDGTYNVYLDGIRILGPITGTNFVNTSGSVQLGGVNPSGDQLDLRFYGVRVRRAEMYSGASFTPPSGPADWGPP